MSCAGQESGQRRPGRDRPRQHTNTAIQAAADRQLRDRLREPEARFADGRQALEELSAKAAAQQRVRPSDASRARALQRLAAECAGLATIIPAAAAPSIWAERLRRAEGDIVVASSGGRGVARAPLPTRTEAAYDMMEVAR
ncbi:hypothetical protein ACIQ9M_34650 [Streptomyces californicus]|uniref:hypothetical protein n=1 Tax=Streptomyces californicus TaxID=67351 RepID=UPI00369F34C6